jgi:hypothetical protein
MKLYQVVIFSVLLSTMAKAQQQSESVFAKNQNFDSEGVELYSSNYQLKSFKKFGFGAALGGMNGLFGVSIEANIVPENALFLGVGGGEGYNAFSAGWKHSFESEYLSPYTKVGYSRWFNTRSSGAVADQSDILRRTLSDEEIRQNRFNVDFVAGGAGIEYNQLEGDLSGVNIFAEVLAMTDINRIAIIPTGSVGLIYFY